MNQKENVLIVHNYYRMPGGEDTVVANEKKMLVENGHEVSFYSRNNNEINSMSPLKKFWFHFVLFLILGHLSMSGV